MKVNKFKKFISILLISIIILAPNLTRNTYANVFGGHWNKNIKIYFNFSGYDKVRGAFGVAKNSWNDILSKIGSNIRINEVYSKSETNLIINVKDYYGMAVGQAFNYPSQTSIYTSGEIIINDNKFNPLSATERSYVATHELGHILGLAHTTGGQYSIMGDEIANIAFPTSYDESELNRIY